jgi:hypothetical protein
MVTSSEAVVLDVFEKNRLRAGAGDRNAMNRSPGESTLMADVGGQSELLGENVARQQFRKPAGVGLPIGDVEAMVLP